MAVEPKEYTKLAAEIMAVRAKKETPLAMVRTYGCQQNVSDGEKIKGMLRANGLRALPRTRRNQIFFCLIPVPSGSTRRTGFSATWEDAENI